MINPEDRFWMVIRADRQTGTSTSKRHHNYYTATVEAQRLARKEKADFIILESKRKVSATVHIDVEPI